MVAHSAVRDSLNISDLSHEQTLSLPRLARAIGHHLNTVRRWVLTGVAGVRLEVEPRGCRFWSSVEAYQRFSVAVAQARVSRFAPPLRLRTERQQRRDQADAMEYLRKRGYFRGQEGARHAAR